MSSSLRTCAIVVLLLGVGAAEDQTSRQPVLLHLSARITDPINFAIDEDQVRRTIATVERLRKQHPETRIAVTLFFSGVASDGLAARNARTHIVDFVRDAVNRGIAEIGYDAADEPAFRSRPHFRSQADLWVHEPFDKRRESAHEFLTQDYDLSGKPIAGKSGGLRRTQEVFGTVVAFANFSERLGGDTEFVHNLLRSNPDMVLFVFPDNSAHPDGDPAHIPGYRGSLRGYGISVSPEPHTPPELSRVNGMLQLPQIAPAVMKPIYLDQGTGELEKALQLIDRGRVHILNVELSSEAVYLRGSYARERRQFPPDTYAYANPERPTYPADALASAAEVDSAYERQQAALVWIIENVVNDGSRFVSCAELPKLTPAPDGFSVSAEDLKKAMRHTFADYQNTHVPDYFKVGGHYLSLAETFGALANMLAEYHATGNMPPRVMVRRLYGPMQMNEDYGMAGEPVLAADVAKACAELAPRLNDTAWRPLPKNAVPDSVTVASRRVNAGQFLRMMADAVQAPSPTSKIPVPASYLFSGAGYTYPRWLVPMAEMGNIWTLKPAPITIFDQTPKTRP